MPLPLMWAVGAITVAAVKKGIDAGTSLKEAGEVKERADKKRDRSEAALKEGLIQVRERGQQLEQQKVAVMGGTIARFAELWERQQKNLKISDKDFTLRLNITPEKLAEFRSVSMGGLDIAKGVAQAGAAGLGAGMGVMGAVGSLGAASTGAAISGLSGAAANSALLAWLGGGTLASGGGGMALGTLVAGGLFVAPAALVGTLIMAKKGQEALTAATEYDKNVDILVKQTDVKLVAVKSIMRRMDEITGLITELVQRLRVSLQRCEDDEAAMNGQVDVEHFYAAAALAKTLSDLLSVPIIDADIEVSAASTAAVNTVTRSLQPSPAHP